MEENHAVGLQKFIPAAIGKWSRLSIIDPILHASCIAASWPYIQAKFKPNCAKNSDSDRHFSVRGPGSSPVQLDLLIYDNEGKPFNSLSSVTGYSRTRTPVALYTAFDIAAATPHKPSSPTPLAFIGEDIGSVSSRKITS